MSPSLPRGRTGDTSHKRDDPLGATERITKFINTSKGMSVRCNLILAPEEMAVNQQIAHSRSSRRPPTSNGKQPYECSQGPSEKRMTTW